MKNRARHKGRLGSLKRTVMIMAGRKGRRPINLQFFLEHRDLILSAWSRTDLEGRIKQWTAARVLPSVWVKGEISRGDDTTWTSEAKALLEGTIWRR